LNITTAAHAHKYDGNKYCTQIQS